uniref:Uncharacterized protein n=1 Tax=Rhizophora mucronata TaxID=61149 RepID=A0A2P2NP29_RHIMU
MQHVQLPIISTLSKVEIQKNFQSLIKSNKYSLLPEHREHFTNHALPHLPQHFMLASTYHQFSVL